MKRISVTIITMLVLALALCSCSGNATESKSVAEMYSSIENEATLPEMLTMSDNDLYDYWGIDVSEYSEYVFKYADGLYADHIFIIRSDDAAVRADAKSFFESYVSYVTTSLANYNPEEAGKIDAAVVKESGNCVYLVISEDVSAICAIIEAGV